MFNQIEKLASAVYNNIVSGLSGYRSGTSISMEQLEDAVVDERLLIIKEYIAKGIINHKDLYLSINCIPVDCDTSLERCAICSEDQIDDNNKVPHFEIPPLLNDLGDNTIYYIGSVDRMNPFTYYTSARAFKYRNYRKRKQNKPYVWIDTTPNKNGMLDCFLFNAPFVDTVSITAAFKDLRQLKQYACCENLEDNKSFLNAEIVDRVTRKMITYYRQLDVPIAPNIQSYTT